MTTFFVPAKIPMEDWIELANFLDNIPRRRYNWFKFEYLSLEDEDASAFILKFGGIYDKCY